MPTYTVDAAKTNLSKLIERAEKGEEIVIARGKKPVVRLIHVGVPAHVLRRRAFDLRGEALPCHVIPAKRSVERESSP